jgi:hypothetical protein
MAWGWPGLHTQPGPPSNNPVKGRPFRSRRTVPALEHADWADPPTVRLTRALDGERDDRDRAARLSRDDHYARKRAYCGRTLARPTTLAQEARQQTTCLASSLLWAHVRDRGERLLFLSMPFPTTSCLVDSDDDMAGKDSGLQV